jgi:hypothetical protein
MAPVYGAPLAAIAVLAATLAGGCGPDDEVIADATSGDEAAAHDAPLRLAGVAPGPNVREVRGGCVAGPDSCESRGDCEAAPIDCGGPDDRFRITAHWASSDDVDLYVTDRLGDTLSFLRPTSLTGGRMIMAEGRSCLPGSELGQEAASWTGGEVALGSYVVTVQHFGSCMSGLGAVDVDVTMSAGGRHLATYRVEVAPQDRLDVLTLDVAE